MAEPAEFNVDSLRDRFAELTKQRDAILEQLAPLREQHDKIVNDARAAADAVGEQMKVIEGPLVAISRELAFIARGLGGKTMKAQPAATDSAAPDVT